MAKSQFTPKLTVAPAKGSQSRGKRLIEVGGPLNIAGRADYDDDPIRVQFQIVQVPRRGRTAEDKRTNRDVKRVRGMGEEVPGKKWAATVELEELQIGRADEINTETRGVAIAVLERKTQFAFDTITWCDEIELVDGNPAKAPPGKPKGKASPKKPAGKAAPAKKPASKASPAKKPRKASPAKRTSGR